MKTRKLLMLLGFAAMLFLSACSENDFYYDNTPPAPPRNVWTVTGDERVDIFWDNNTERDVAGYNVYYNYTYEGTYTLLGSTTDNTFIDWGAQNGVTYYYAVAAYDDNGNESELSYDVVYDTPRPEGFDVQVYDFNSYPTISGYDFSDFVVTSYNGDGADFFFENYNGTFYLNVWAEDTDIQDMGLTYDIYDISYAPDNGWVPAYDGDNVKYVEAIPGHTYVIWTWDDHYAKVRINSITPETMSFDWAYQLVEGEKELKRHDFDRQALPGQLHKNYSR